MSYFDLQGNWEKKAQFTSPTNSGYIYKMYRYQGHVQHGFHIKIQLENKFEVLIASISASGYPSCCGGLIVHGHNVAGGLFDNPLQTEYPQMVLNVVKSVSDFKGNGWIEGIIPSRSPDSFSPRLVKRYFVLAALAQIPGAEISSGIKNNLSGYFDIRFVVTTSFLAEAATTESFSCTSIDFSHIGYTLCCS